MYKSYLNNINLPLGLRNNNPGNLVRTSITWDGEIASNTGKFEQFKELRWGLRALYRDIISDVKKGTNTIQGLINEFAPAFENQTASYIATVSNMIGLDMNAKIELSEETIVGIAKAICYVENGSAYAKYITDEDYQDALDILGIPLKKKRATTL